RYSLECCVDLAICTGSHDNELQPKRTHSRLDVPQLSLAIRKIRIHQHRDDVGTGTSSRSSPSRFDASSAIRLLTPVTLPPGRFKLATRPNLIGSFPVVNTIGTVEVAAFAASAAGVVVAANTVTLRPTRSAASAGSRS